MSTEIAVHELVGITTACHTCIAGLSVDRSICVRQHLVFDASAYRQPVKFNEHWGDMITTSCSRYHTCARILQSLHFVGY